MNITEDMLRNAAAEVREAMLDSLPPQEDMNHVFSRRFEAIRHFSELPLYSSHFCSGVGSG